MESSEILINIRKIVRSINLESKRIQKEYGVSIPQLLALQHLKNGEGRQSTHKEIMKLLALNSSTVTGILNRLEKKGYLARLAKGSDKRVSIIGLTSKGEALLDKSPLLLHEKLEQRLQELSGSQFDEIKNALTKLVSILGIEQMDASPMITMEEPITPKDSE